MTRETILNDLIDKHRDLIIRLGRRFNYDQNDLFQVGCIGLIKAFTNGDDTKPEFRAYARTYILGEMRKLMREDKPIKVSRELKYAHSKILKIKERLTQDFMREPTNQEIADYIEEPVELVEQAILANQFVSSIDAPVAEDLSPHEVIGNTDHLLMEANAIANEVFDKLSPKERVAILGKYYYGLSQSEVASKINTNQVGISRTTSRALKRIRSQMKT